MHFRVSSLGQGTEWGIIFWVAKISNIILGCLKFLIFLGEMVDAGAEPTYEEKMRVPTTPTLPALTLYLRVDILHKNVKKDLFK